MSNTRRALGAKYWAALVCAAVAAWLVAAEAHAQTGARSTPVVSLMTFGPGDQAFAKFGHNALLVHDPTRPPGNRDLVFNYGTFSFNSPLLAVDFLKGDLQYWLSVSDLARTVAAYRAANRSVMVKRLALSPEQAREVVRFLYDNAKPENRYYRYDYYRDNCSTRVRDLIDRAIGGALRDGSDAVTPYSYRDHTRRLTVDSPLLFFGLDLAMGPAIDRPITQWEAMFLPMELDAKVADLSVARSEGSVRLVSDERVLFRAERPDTPASPAISLWPWLAGGLALGTLLYAAGRARPAAGRWAFALGVSLFGLLAGAAGALMLVLWGFTDHEVTYANQNVLLCPFWAIALPFLAVDLARAQPRRPRLLLWWFAAALASVLLALLIQLVAPASQHNGPALALLAPAWLGAGLGAWERLGRPTFRPRVRPRERVASDQSSTV